MYASCCSKWVECSECHDEMFDHQYVSWLPFDWLSCITVFEKNCTHTMSKLYTNFASSLNYLDIMNVIFWQIRVQ